MLHIVRPSDIDLFVLTRQPRPATAAMKKKKKKKKKKSLHRHATRSVVWKPVL